MKTLNSKPIAALVAVLALAIGGIQSAVFAADKDIVNAADTKFIKQIGQAGMDEVKIATLGTQKAERADIKDFATMLVNDHTKANSEVMTLSQSKGVSLSAIEDAKAVDAFKDLEKESGKDFDKAFLNQMEKDHKKCIDLFEDAEKKATDGDLKSWVSKTLPTLRAHLDKVKELQSK